MNKSFGSVIGLLILGAILYVPFFGWHYSTGSGEHTGFVTAVEHNGVVFKTGRVYVKTDPQSSQEDSYCVVDPKVYEQLRSFSEAKSSVTVEYDSWLVSGLKNCGGESAVIVRAHGKYTTVNECVLLSKDIRINLNTKECFDNLSPEELLSLPSNKAFDLFNEVESYYDTRTEAEKKADADFWKKAP